MSFNPRRLLVPLERWAVCPVNERYEVSTIGRVRVLKPYKRPKGQLVGIRYDKRYGYAYVDLWKDSKARRYYVHKLVLLAFRGPKPPGMESLHVDGNRRNFRLSNLRWGTRKENVADAQAHGTWANGYALAWERGTFTPEKLAERYKAQYGKV